ncbi:Activating signal cointegrator 1 [Blattella germanica]|nr:Activating signal cointegrator 1 [Blattella germanica]
MSVGSTENLFDWMNRRLSQILDFPVPEDLTQYILSIENVRDLEDYLKTLLDFKNLRHRQFHEELLQKRQIGLSNSLEFQGYKKSEQQESYIPAKQTEKKRKNKNQTDDAPQKETPPSGEGKKKSKFVNLYSADGQAKDVIMLKEQQLMNSGLNKGNQLYQKLIEQKGPEGWDSAVQHRNRLLEYDRTSEKRTRVIDDESDYFTSNSVWLSKAERDKLKQKEEDEDENFYEPGESITKEINQMLHDESDSLVDPGIMYLSPKFQDLGGPETLPMTAKSHWEDSVHKIVQDREMLEMTDEGRCLSMHQPWASLLVSGIKIHEGRNWHTSHRGRLWIAATVKVPSQEEINQLEHFYQLLKGNEHIRFPSQYPTGCLLGCVTVVDVLPQEEYRLKFPNGESDSPFVFICKDPKVLPVKFPIQGRHKIYKLDPKIHVAAQKSLQRLGKIQSGRMTQD